MIQDRCNTLEEQYAALRSEKHTFPSTKSLSQNTQEPWAAALQDFAFTDKFDFETNTFYSCNLKYHLDATVNMGHSSKNTDPKSNTYL